jgi:hypothetical protein
MFNQLISKSVDCIFTSATGSISVPAGTYQVNIMSNITTMGTRFSPEAMPGYCILRELLPSETSTNDSKLDGKSINVLASGTVSDCSLNIPSIISTVIIIPKRMSLVVNHQFRISENEDYTTYLNVHGGESSTVHLSASMCLIKLA